MERLRTDIVSLLQRSLGGTTWGNQNDAFEHTTIQTSDCSLCDVTWAPMSHAGSPDRLGRAVNSVINVIGRAESLVRNRPTSYESRFPTEYGGHVRDVVLSIRERAILGRC